MQDMLGLGGPVMLHPPQHIIESLQRYSEAHVPTGQFLRSVLENDLKGAVGMADSTNQYYICGIVSWCYNNLPSTCWGSVEKVSAHLAARPEPAEAKEERVASRR